MILEGLTSERLYFRGLTKDDHQNFMPFFKDPEAMKYYHLNERPEVICENWISRQQDRYEKDGFGLCVLCDKENDIVVGQCGLLKQFVDGKEELEVGYGLLPSQWGKGYATESARRCIKYAFDNNWSESVISIIDINNESSKHVALRNAMRLIKKTSFKGYPVNIFSTDNKNWPFH